MRCKVIFVKRCFAVRAGFHRVAVRQAPIVGAAVLAGIEMNKVVVKGYRISVGSCRRDQRILIGSGKNGHIAAEGQRAVGFVGIMAVADCARAVTAADSEHVAVDDRNAAALALIAAADASASVFPGTGKMVQGGQRRVDVQTGEVSEQILELYKLEPADDGTVLGVPVIIDRAADGRDLAVLDGDGAAVPAVSAADPRAPVAGSGKYAAVFDIYNGMVFRDPV